MCYTFAQVSAMVYMRVEKLLTAVWSCNVGAPRTTKIHDRTGDEITLDEVERIAI
jgi:hypothetical protein